MSLLTKNIEQISIELKRQKEFVLVKLEDKKMFVIYTELDMYEVYRETSEKKALNKFDELVSNDI